MKINRNMHDADKANWLKGGKKRNREGSREIVQRKRQRERERETGAIKGRRETERWRERKHRSKRYSCLAIAVSIQHYALSRSLP